MKKVVGFILIILAAFLIGCSLDNKASAGDEHFSYYESVDKKSTNSSILKLVDKETGCRYLIVKSTSNGFTSTVQMLGKDGLPVCD